MKATGKIGPPTNTPAAPAIAEIEDPLTGELIDANDVDALITLFEQLKANMDAIATAKGLICQALAAKTEGDTKTRRIVGKTRAAKVEMPSTKWDNSKLKEAYHAYPGFRDLYLRIAKIEPDLRQVNKLRNTSGPADLELFKKIVLSAESPPTANPSITIEK